MKHQEIYRKIGYRTIASLCTAILAFTVFAGCSPSKTTGGDESKTTPSSNAQAASGEESGISAPNEFPIVKEKTTLSVFIQQLPYMLTDVTTNTFTKELEEKTNVHLDMMVVPSDSRVEKLNMMLAGGDYPEVLMSAAFGNSDLVKYGTEEKILIPINDLIEKHGKNIKERWADSPNMKTQMTTLDGNMYAIPTGVEKQGHGACSYKMWLNTAWLDQLGLQTPTTTEEFRDVLQAFKDKDPNGNGKKDEIPLTGAINTWSADIHLFLLNAFGYFNPDSLVMLKDDKFSSCIDTDGVKEGLKYVSELYKAGLIDPAALTQNEAQLSALGNNANDVIVGSAACGHLGMMLSINDVPRSSMYTCLEPLKGPSGYQGIPYAVQPNVSGGTFAITDKCKQPEVAIKLADYLCSDEAGIRMSVGIKGKHWDDADAGAFGMDGKTPAKYKYLTYNTSGEGASENDVWSNTASLLESYWKGMFQVDGDINDPTNYEARLQRETEKLLPYAADVQDIPPLFMDEDASTRSAQLFKPIQDYVKASIVEFITGKKNPEKDWDSYVSGLKNLGYEEYITLQQSAYDAQTN